MAIFPYNPTQPVASPIQAKPVAPQIVPTTTTQAPLRSVVPTTTPTIAVPAQGQMALNSMPTVKPINNGATTPISTGNVAPTTTTPYQTQQPLPINTNTGMTPGSNGALVSQQLANNGNLQLSNPMPPATQSAENQALGGGNSPNVMNFMKTLGQNGSNVGNNQMNTPANSAINQQGQAANLYANSPNTSGVLPTGSLASQSNLQLPTGTAIPTSNNPSGVLPTGSLASKNNLQLPTGVVSDENAKTNIEDGNKDINHFLQSIGAHKYTYKDKADGDGTYVSPMAQELEKTNLGKSAVVEDPSGKKMVQYARLSGVMLSAQATLHERLKNIEKQLKIKVKK